MGTLVAPPVPFVLRVLGTPSPVRPAGLGPPTPQLLKILGLLFSFKKLLDITHGLLALLLRSSIFQSLGFSLDLLLVIIVRHGLFLLGSWDRGGNLTLR